MSRGILLLASVLLLLGCRSVRQPDVSGPSDFSILSYNINWGGAGIREAANILRDSSADIVCLQETTPEWKRFLEEELKTVYPFGDYRDSADRMGGGLAFLSKVPAREIAYIPSGTGWFDGWIMLFETKAGPIQVLNVHLRPPVSDRGSWVSGYVTTRDDRVKEMERFHKYLRPGVPGIIAGDFNDSEKSPVVSWLEERGFVNSLPEFDRSTETWRWNYRGVVLKRRMDHIFYSKHLYCGDSKVLKGGASDHFPVVARFRRQVF